MLQIGEMHSIRKKENQRKHTSIPMHKTSLCLARFVQSLLQKDKECSIAMFEEQEEMDPSRLYDLIFKIFYKARMEPESLIVAAKYIYDFTFVKRISISTSNVRRILICAMVLAN